MDSGRGSVAGRVSRWTSGTAIAAANTTRPSAINSDRRCAWTQAGVIVSGLWWRYTRPSVNTATVVAPGQRRSGPAGTPERARSDEEWVLLAYRLPRGPSGPRPGGGGRLKRPGVVQVADGVVALPADARTREALEWIAEEVVDHDGEATVGLARPPGSRA